LDDIASGFRHLVESGKVRAVGFSNSTVTLMKKVIDLLPADFPVASSQQEYNLAERFVERSILPFCQSHGMGLLAYSPLGQGKLANGDTAARLGAIAAKYNTNAASLVLIWLARQRQVIPIPMTSNIEHLEDNVAALAQTLPAEFFDEVEKVFPAKIVDIPVTSIRVTGSHTGKAYVNLSDARANILNLSPSPQELARELMDGEMLKPVKVRVTTGKDGEFELFEGQLRYWAWRIAHEDRLPVPAQLC
jgi:predicted aldo/keto reductase-like oxidoreductase